MPYAANAMDRGRGLSRKGEKGGRKEGCRVCVYTYDGNASKTRVSWTLLLFFWRGVVRDVRHGLPSGRARNTAVSGAHFRGAFSVRPASSNEADLICRGVAATGTRCLVAVVPERFLECF